jgi:hypothetical protein
VKVEDIGDRDSDGFVFRVHKNRKARPRGAGPGLDYLTART